MGFRSSAKFDSEEALYDYAVAALARRMRSIAELKRRLRQRVQAETVYGQTLVEVVIRKLKDQGYLNDARYAAAYSCFRRDNEKFGRRRVIHDLKTKGVHGEIVDTAVASAYNGLSEEQQARAFMRRKRLVKPKNRKQAARIFRQLVRAGFDAKTIFSILKKWDVDEEMLDSLQAEIS
jgi:regulatory protein